MAGQVRGETLQFIGSLRRPKSAASAPRGGGSPRPVASPGRSPRSGSPEREPVDAPAAGSPGRSPEPVPRVGEEYARSLWQLPPGGAAATPVHPRRPPRISSAPATRGRGSPPPMLLNSPAALRRDLVHRNGLGEFASKNASLEVGEALAVLNDLRANYNKMSTKRGVAGDAGLAAASSPPPPLPPPALGGSTTATPPPVPLPQVLKEKEDPHYMSERQRSPRSPSEKVAMAPRLAAELIPKDFVVPGERMEQRIKRRAELKRQQAAAADMDETAFNIPCFLGASLEQSMRDDPFALTMRTTEDLEDPFRLKRMEYQAAVARLLRGEALADPSEDGEASESDAASAAVPMSKRASRSSHGTTRPPASPRGVRFTDSVDGDGDAGSKHDRLPPHIPPGGQINLNQPAVNLLDAKRMISSLIEEITAIHGRYKAKLGDMNARFQVSIEENTGLMEELERSRYGRVQTENELREKTEVLEAELKEIGGEKADLVKLTESLRELLDKADDRAGAAEKALEEVTADRDAVRQRKEVLAKELKQKKQLIEDMERRRALTQAEMLGRVAELEGALQTQKVRARKMIRETEDAVAGKKLAALRAGKAAALKVVAVLERERMARHDADAGAKPRDGLASAGTAVTTDGLMSPGPVLPRSMSARMSRKGSMLVRPAADKGTGAGGFAPLDFTLLTMPITDLDAKGLAMNHPVRRAVQGLADNYATAWNEAVEKLGAFWHWWKASSTSGKNAVKTFEDLKASAYGLLKDVLVVAERHKLKYLLKLVKVMHDVAKTGQGPSVDAPGAGGGGSFRRKSALPSPSSMNRFTDGGGGPPKRRGSFVPPSMSESPFMASLAGGPGDQSPTSRTTRSRSMVPMERPRSASRWDAGGADSPIGSPTAQQSPRSPRKGREGRADSDASEASSGASDACAFEVPRLPSFTVTRGGAGRRDDATPGDEPNYSPRDGEDSPHGRVGSGASSAGSAPSPSAARGGLRRRPSRMRVRTGSQSPSGSPRGESPAHSHTPPRRGVRGVRSPSASASKAERKASETPTDMMGSLRGAPPRRATGHGGLHRSGSTVGRKASETPTGRKASETPTGRKASEFGSLRGSPPRRPTGHAGLHRSGSTVGRKASETPTDVMGSLRGSPPRKATGQFPRTASMSALNESLHCSAGPSKRGSVQAQAAADRRRSSAMRPDRKPRRSFAAVSSTVVLGVTATRGRAAEQAERRRSSAMAASQSQRGGLKRGTSMSKIAEQSGSRRSPSLSANRSPRNTIHAADASTTSQRLSIRSPRSSMKPTREKDRQSIRSPRGSTAPRGVAAFNTSDNTTGMFFSLQLAGALESASERGDDGSPREYPRSPSAQLGASAIAPFTPLSPVSGGHQGLTVLTPEEALEWERRRSSNFEASNLLTTDDSPRRGKQGSFSARTRDPNVRHGSRDNGRNAGSISLHIGSTHMDSPKKAKKKKADHRNFERRASSVRPDGDRSERLPSCVDSPGRGKQRRASRLPVEFQEQQGGEPPALGALQTGDAAGLGSALQTPKPAGRRPSSFAAGLSGTDGRAPPGDIVPLVPDSPKRDDRFGGDAESAASETDHAAVDPASPGTIFIHSGFAEGSDDEGDGAAEGSMFMIQTPDGMQLPPPLVPPDERQPSYASDVSLDPLDAKPLSPRRGPRANVDVHTKPSIITLHTAGDGAAGGGASDIAISLHIPGQEAPESADPGEASTPSPL
eukprot:TRINITY_DN1604_c0_g1_i1.p1 TRINITY_DN1604_c0_g1~~TRINITY_DN1604_c0_g1_i1.p1  ORF type:complete len:1765 (+),score=537.26 TRINITY_DN1604_c0_g1_i1:148-5295(+)